MLDSRMDIRVEWAHCDPATIVYNPHYFDWMDRGVHRLFEAGGFRLEQMVREDPTFTACRWSRQARPSARPRGSATS